MKTLVVTYLPRSERSKTKMVLDAFLSQAKQKGDIQVLDLISDTPDMFLGENLMAYVLKYYAGQKLTAHQQKLLDGMEKLARQFKSADAVVVAYPMYNFSMPAVVKAYFDAVLLKGITWDMDGSGYKGLMSGKKALIVLSAGGDYSTQQMAGWEHALSLTKTLFAFCGFSDIREVPAWSANGPNAGESVKKASEAARKVAQDWNI
ncbi:MAG: NAD(P)H-dependent oxidoreductase [Candidatus Micrarchaeia archaeon]|jgi:FMN-dependent NADH-azoreductase